ncbi:MAG: NifB/NifX family molybdenum-iron cluster-binding protein [bacterium]
MKVAVTTTGKNLDAPFEYRFGRAPGFIIYDTDEKSFEIIDNSMNLKAAQGAGIQAAKDIVKSGATALITGHCGPKAFQILSQKGVQIYNAKVENVAEAVEFFVEGKLTPLKSPDVGGRWR